ncbi:MAG: xanthine dehydrogenase family protein subunit M [Betaproteobacteria bacterium]|nr:xanthine dehydrogenase family protein subunit M [Betaproteobacteria bacterium]MDH5342516.1 xanthine dehydrogenase family protein subunit M [Betaproteobacteria bacterium]
MRAFNYVAAGDIQQAVRLLAEHGSEAKILAGGTDLLADLKSSPHPPRMVIDISRTQGLGGIEVTDKGLRIGALVTHTEIMKSSVIQEHFPALVDAAHTIGAVQTRNLGTLGGNLVTAVPSMDSGPTLMALDAWVVLAGNSGNRQMPLTEFFKGPRRTALKPDELLMEIVIPAENIGKPVNFLKSGLRKGQALALVNAAGSLWLDAKGRIREPRIALGAVAPTVIRAPNAEKCLAGQVPTPEIMVEAGKIAAEECKPITDFRASATYRKEIVEVLVKRVLMHAHAQALKK